MNEKEFKISEKVFPTATEFIGNISTFQNKVEADLTCSFCAGKIYIKLNLPENDNTNNYSDEFIKQRVLLTAHLRHNCPAKNSLIGDKTILQKVAPDILRGYEKLKESIYDKLKRGIKE